MAVTALCHHVLAQGHRDVVLLNYLEVLHSLRSPVLKCPNNKVPIWRSALLSASLLALERRHCVSAVSVQPDDSFAVLLALVSLHNV